ncbi:MAG: VWA domain-containing protein [Chloroflexota bacterium]
MLFRFAAPGFLLLLLAAIAIFYWQVRFGRAGQPRLRFSSLRVAGLMVRSFRQRLRPLPDLLRAFALVLLVVGLARPTVSRPVEASPGSGIDIVLALDISSSMSASDLGVRNRLETAKNVIREFLANRTGDRVGLVGFASEAVTVSPLSLDYPILLGLLDDINFGRLPDGTAIGHGLATAVNLLRDAKGKSRVVILLTDGENNAGDIAPGTAAKMAQALNIRAYTILAGASGSRPRPGSNRPAPASPGEETLQEISNLTGGSFFRATDEETLRQIYEAIGRLEKTETGQQKFVEVIDLGFYLFLGGVVALLLELLLRNSWLRRAP